MNPDDYCRDKAAPAGSAAYYALREAPASLRPLLTALFALRRELRQTVDECVDADVARTKFAWWRREISLFGGRRDAPLEMPMAGVDLVRMLAGPSAEPRDGLGDRTDDTAPPTYVAAHPVLRALAAHLADPAALCDALLALVAAYETDLDQARYASFDALERYLASTGGDFAALLVQAAQRHHTALIAPAVVPTPSGLPGSAESSGATMSIEPAREWAARLGAATLFAELVADVGSDARHGRIYLPIDELQRFSVPAADIMQRRYSVEFTALMSFEAERARAALRSALAHRPGRVQPHRGAYRTLVAQAALALATLDEVQRDGYQVLHQQIALTPLRKLLVAWRAAGRLRRGSL